MLSIVRACAIVGLDGWIIEVQTDFNPRRRSQISPSWGCPTTRYGKVENG